MGKCRGCKLFIAGTCTVSSILAILLHFLHISIEDLAGGLELPLTFISNFFLRVLNFVLFLMNFSRHESVLSRVKRGTIIVVLKFTATCVQVTIAFICECPLTVSIRLASARNSLRMRSDNFPHRDFDIIFRHVRTFPGVVVDVASVLA